MRERIILYALAAVNVLAFALFGVDKAKARHHRWRVPERVLLGTAALGGAPGAILGMMFFHHKTRHKKFRCGLPVMLTVQILLGFLIVKYVI